MCIHTVKSRYYAPPRIYSPQICNPISIPNISPPVYTPPHEHRPIKFLQVYETGRLLKLSLFLKCFHAFC